MAQHSASLLVMSVFAKTDRNPDWVNLQYRFLDRTTPSYDHVVSLHMADRSLFRRSTILRSIHAKRCASRIHGRLLQGLLDYARKTAYDYYLFLDSDAFPVADNWLVSLVSKMGDRSFAAPVRTENLDLFPHPSCFFVRAKDIHRKELDFRVGRSINLLQQQVEDTGCRLPLRMCYPLLRSNVYNPHPLLAGVYGNLFYHHGCGSRRFAMRSTFYHDYFNRLEPDHETIEDSLFLALTSDPDSFLCRLRGNSQ